MKKILFIISQKILFVSLISFPFCMCHHKEEKINLVKVVFKNINSKYTICEYDTMTLEIERNTFNYCGKTSKWSIKFLSDSLLLFTANDKVDSFLSCNYNSYPESNDMGRIYNFESKNDASIDDGSKIIFSTEIGLLAITPKYWKGYKVLDVIVGDNLLNNKCLKAKTSIIGNLWYFERKDTCAINRNIPIILPD